MSTTLHAFSTYTVDENDEINYENDKSFDIAYGNWHYIYTALQYAEYLNGVELNIPIYDFIEDGWQVKKNGMNLTEPVKFIIGLERVLTELKQLKDNENPLIDGCSSFLFENDKEESYQKQKEKLIHYAEMLFKFTQKGLYFVEERE